MHGLEPPSAWVSRWLGAMPPGEVLDLACGRGRHARLLAAAGHAVLALDRDAAALDALAGVPGVTTVCADLEDGRPWPLGGQRFSAIVVTSYLHRPLFAAIAASLAPGGLLVYETFMLGNERHGRPSSPAFLLQPGELLGFAALGLEIVAFEQGLRERPGPAMVQRLCARAGVAEPVVLPA
jgi:SAM-dependent methyltransferase